MQAEIDSNDSRASALSRGACRGLKLLLFLVLLGLAIMITLWFISPYYFLHPPIANVTNSTESQHLSFVRSTRIVVSVVLILCVVALFFLLRCNNNSFSITCRLIFYPLFTKLPISKSEKKETDTR